MELKEQIEAITAEVKASEAVLLAGMKKSADEVKELGETTRATAAEVKAADERNKRALIEQAELYAANQKKMQEQIDEIEKKAQRPQWGQPDDTSQEKSIGEQFVELVREKVDEFKSGFQREQIRGLPSVGFKSFHRQPGEHKALSLTETTNFAEPYRVPGFVPLGMRRLRMRDLFRVVSTNAPSIRYLRKLGFSPATEAAVTSITQSAGTATMTTTAAHGMTTGDWIYITGASPAAYNGKKQITVTGASTLTFAIASATASPATGTITVVRLNNFGSAAGVSEGGVKPEAKFRYEEVLAPVEVIAHWIQATRQVLDDMPGLRADVDGDLVYGLRREEERQLLYGTGTTPQIQGAMTLPGTQSFAWSSGNVGDTKIDAIRRAAGLVYRAEYEPDAVVLGDIDWTDIELTKGSDDHYILMQSPEPGNDPNAVRIWRLPLVVTNSMAAGDFLVGNFGLSAALYDREQANVRFSDQHGEYFTSNKVAILAEERIVPAWKRPEALVAGDFDSAPEAP